MLLKLSSKGVRVLAVAWWLYKKYASPANTKFAETMPVVMRMVREFMLLFSILSVARGGLAKTPPKCVYQGIARRGERFARVRGAAGWNWRELAKNLCAKSWPLVAAVNYVTLCRASLYRPPVIRVAL